MLIDFTNLMSVGLWCLRKHLALWDQFLFREVAAHQGMWWHSGSDGMWWLIRECGGIVAQMGCGGSSGNMVV